MKIFITTPSFAIHGGIRIILEWANRLTKWHDVTLHSLSGDQCTWFVLDPKVKVQNSPGMAGQDCLIITSPHSIDFDGRDDTPDKVFIFAQMAEHLFCDVNADWYPLWYDKCLRFYTSKRTMFSISEWNRKLFYELGRDIKSKTHAIWNGVNFEHFPISYRPKDGKIILVEGWECTNPSKDIDNIGPKVAARLKAEGYFIAAYSQKKLRTMREVPNVYWHKPDLATLNDLYEKATILIKATKYDARSCSPLEAMTKGTITVRAIIEGDDDLNDDNSIRVGYDEEQLYQACKKVLNHPDKMSGLAKEARMWVQHNCDWDLLMNDLNVYLLD